MAGAKIGPLLMRLRSSTADLIPVLVLVGAVGAVFFPALFQGKLPFNLDLFHFFYQVAALSAGSLARGELPVWNPYQVAGMPLLADPGSAALYPLVVLPALLFGATDAFRFIIPLHFLLAALFCYWYLRVLGSGPAGSLYSALLFGLGSYLLFRTALPPMVWTTIWWPMVFACTALTIRARRPVAALGWSALGGAGLGAAFLAALPQGFFYLVLGALGYAAYLAVGRVARVWTRQCGRRALLPLLYFAVAPIVAAGLTAIQLLPSLELVSLSNRAEGYPPELVGGQSWQELLALAAGLTRWTCGWGEYCFVQTLTPFALLLVLLAVLGVRLGRDFGFHLGLAVVAGLLALNSWHPLDQALAMVVPRFASIHVHVPTRVLVATAFGLAVCAGLGLDALARGGRLPARTWLAALGVQAALLLAAVWTGSDTAYPPAALVCFFVANLSVATLSNRFQVRWGPYALVSLLAIELYFYSGSILGDEPRLAASHPTLSWVDPRGYFAPPPAVTLLRTAGDSRLGEARFFGFEPAIASVYPRRTYSDTVGGPLASQLLLLNLASAFNLHDVQGYNPLHLTRYDEFIADLNGTASSDGHTTMVLDPFSPLLKYVSAGYLLTTNQNPSIALLPRRFELNGNRRVVEPSNRDSSPLVDQVVLESALAESAGIAQGTTVGRIDLVAPDSTRSSFAIRAGMEVADWAYDRTDIRPVVQHQRPEIARSWPDAGYEGHTYRAVLRLGQPQRVASVRLELLNPALRWRVEALSARGDLSADYEPVYRDEAVRLLRAKLNLPRAFLVHSVEQIPSSRWILERLKDPAFDARQTVIVEEPPNPATIALGAPLVTRRRWADGRPSGSPRSDEAVTFLDEGENRVRLRVRAREPGMVVLNDVDYPAWRAYVDGIPTTIYRANHSFRAVPVPRGDHHVEFRYESDALSLGAAISAGTLALLVTILAAAGWTAWRATALKEGGPPALAG
jgi:hypothetical protein